MAEAETWLYRPYLTMKTSNYILELIISGFSAIIWLGLLMLCFIKFPIETLA